MTLQELAYKIDKIMCMDAVLDPEVYIQIGGIQAPVNGISYFPEIDGVMDAVVMIAGVLFAKYGPIERLWARYRMGARA